jgi:hypothetical protein
MLELGLQATVLLEHLVDLLRYRHSLLEALQLGFELTQRLERHQTFLPKGMWRIKPCLLSQVTDRQVLRLADHPGRRFLVPGQDAQKGSLADAIRA